jgi:small basic protein
MIINTSIGEILGIVSGIVLLVSAFFILKQIKEGLSTPNLTTWMIGMLVGLINAFSFYRIVGDNIYQGFIMFASLITLVIIFFYSLSKGKFAKLKTFDIILLFLAVFVGIFWKFTDNRLANFLVQIVICIANFATIIGLWRGYLREYYFSWIFALGAYVIAILGLAIDFTGDWLPFFGPILNGVICNGLVLLLSITKNKKSEKWKQKSYFVLLYWYFFLINTCMLPITVYLPMN